MEFLGCCAAFQERSPFGEDPPAFAMPRDGSTKPAFTMRKRRLHYHGGWLNTKSSTGIVYTPHGLRAKQTLSATLLRETITLAMCNSPPDLYLIVLSSCQRIAGYVPSVRRHTPRSTRCCQFGVRTWLSHHPAHPGEVRPEPTLLGQICPSIRIWP
jgi:hypothetical protein